MGNLDLEKARAALVNAGYCGAGPHGSGDPEVNAIDRVLQGWQPIESAPRDEAILIAGGDILYPITASWSGLPDEAWCLDSQGDVGEEIDGRPTHWMALAGLNFPAATPLPESETDAA